MGVSVWARMPPPPTDGTSPWQEQTGGLAELSALRRRLRTALDDAVLPRGSDDGERLLLVVEELLSNALRHGRAPVHLALSAPDLGWLVAVSDTAPDSPPMPALDRDPSDGGMGLSLVARICRVHGWEIDGDRKIVWARVPYLEPVTAGRALEVRRRARILVAGLADTAARTAGILDEVAAQGDAAGRTALARRCRAAAMRARLDLERAQGLILSAAPPTPRPPAD